MRLFKQIFSVFLLFALIANAQGQTGYARFEVDSSSIIAPGSTITIHLLSDQKCSGWYIDGVAEINASGNQTILPFGGTVSNLRVDAADMVPNTSTIIGDSGSIHNYNGALFSGFSGFFMEPLPEGYPIISFDYTINSLWNGSPITIAPLSAGKSFNWAQGESYHVDASTAYIYTYNDVPIQGVTLSSWQTHLRGDLNGDNIINYMDLAIMASQWNRTPANPSADIAPLPNGDNIVNLLDYAMLAQYFTDSY